MPSLRGPLTTASLASVVRTAEVLCAMAHRLRELHSQGAADAQLLELLDEGLRGTYLSPLSPESVFQKNAYGLIEISDQLGGDPVAPLRGLLVPEGDDTDTTLNLCLRTAAVVRARAGGPLDQDDDEYEYLPGYSSGPDTALGYLDVILENMALHAARYLEVVVSADKFMGPQDPSQCRKVMSWLRSIAAAAAHVAADIERGDLPCDGPVEDGCCGMHESAVAVIASLSDPGFKMGWAHEDVTGAYFGVTWAEFPDGSRYPCVTGASHSIFGREFARRMCRFVQNSRGTDDRSVGHLKAEMYQLASNLLRDMDPDTDWTLAGSLLSNQWLYWPLGPELAPGGTCGTHTG